MKIEEVARDLEARIGKKTSSIHRLEQQIGVLKEALRCLKVAGQDEKERHICGADGTIQENGCEECMKLDEYIAQHAEERSGTK